MKKMIVLGLAVLMVLTMLVACGPTTSEPSAPAESNGTSSNNEVPSGEKEDYVWACQYNSLPLFVNNDYIGMDLAAEELGVNIRKVGPQEIDLNAFVAAIEQEIVKKPDGMMVVGWDPSLKVAIDKAVDAGIPVVTVDADVPESKRLCFVGTDWRQMGVIEAQTLAPYLEGKSGTACVIGMPTANNNILRLEGFTTEMAKLCPDITVEQQIYDSTSNAQKVAEITANLISSKSDLIALCGYDSTCGPGIATAIKEANMAGKIFATCSDAEIEHVQPVKDGYIVAAIGQKRHFFTYYGLKMLYDYNHSKINFTKDDAKYGITHIPDNIATGFIVVTKDNADAILEVLNERTK